MNREEILETAKNIAPEYTWKLYCPLNYDAVCFLAFKPTGGLYFALYIDGSDYHLIEWRTVILVMKATFHKQCLDAENYIPE